MSIYQETFPGICVSCGRAVPEGSLLCWHCEHEYDEPAPGSVEQQKKREEEKVVIHVIGVDESSPQEKIIIRRIEPPAPKPFYNLFKRGMDFVAALIGSFILILPMLLIALAIKLDSKGPVFYRQERLGLNGRPFILWKFRSMRVDAEKDGAKWATDHDSRCTRVGEFLRLHRLDELPQIPFNILMGNLSIVGPRPERAVFYRQFAEYMVGFDQRLLVMPGLTGLAQINGGYDLKPEEKIIFDLEYIEKRSLWLDIKIMLKTVGIVFSHKGAR